MSKKVIGEYENSKLIEDEKMNFIANGPLNQVLMADGAGKLREGLSIIRFNYIALIKNSFIDMSETGSDFMLKKSGIYMVDTLVQFTNKPTENGDIKLGLSYFCGETITYVTGPIFSDIYSMEVANEIYLAAYFKGYKNSKYNFNLAWDNTNSLQYVAKTNIYYVY